MTHTASDKEFLHRKIAEMSQRIQELEDALALLQASISTEKHVLLQNDLLLIKNIPERHRSPEQGTHEDPLAEPVDAFGTLTIDDSGESRYLGASAGSEAESEPDDEKPIPEAMPELLNTLAATFPVGNRCPPGSETCEIAMAMLFSSLPPRHRASSLCEAFLEQACWLFQPVKRDELFQDILSPIYAAKDEREYPFSAVATEVSPHKLSVLYSIFAVGAAADLRLAAFNAEGERYHHFARAALVLRSIFDSPMIETVQAILLMVCYCSQSVQRYTRDSVWVLSSLGCHVAQSIGMHRDPARWQMDVKTAQRRRTLFWEVFSANQMLSLSLGRPPSLSLSYVDCDLPHVQSESSPEDHFWHWKYQFHKIFMSAVMEATLGTNIPNYKSILELDRKIREIYLPPALDYFAKCKAEEAGLNAAMKGGYHIVVRATCLLYIHKSYFARALIDYPEDPLRSPYATSFLATARCSSVIIRANANHIRKVPELCTRWWTLWTGLFSSALVSGLIVTRAPSSSMAPAAFAELSLATKLFESCAQVSRRVRAGMNILHRLKEKASMLLNQHRNGFVTPPPALQDDGNDIDALAIYSGQMGRFRRSVSPRLPVAVDRAAGGDNLTAGPIFNPATSTRIEGHSAEIIFQSSGSVPELMETHGAHWSPKDHISLHAPKNAIAEPVSFDQLSGTFEASPPTIDISAPYSSASPFPVVSPTSEQHAARIPSTSFASASSADPFQQLYAEMFASDSNTRGIDESNLSMNGENMLDEDWMLFMKESGLL
ncbi:hypothetical protein HWV62_43750 [Athelia sp. TMB]|nr:hypothetical protein HWV62_43750 [Athelia sp. TMB]